MLSSLRTFAKDEVARQRLRIMEFYDRYGEQATKAAFGADRKVISRWRQKLNRHDGALAGLVPESTRPKRARTMTSHIRQMNPRVLKEPAPVVGIAALGYSFITLAIKPWASVEDFVTARAEIYQVLLESFREKKIEIPGPRHSVRLINQPS